MSFWVTAAGLATSWMSGRQKRQDQEHEQEIEEIKAGLRDNDRLLRRGSFVLLSIPFIWAHFDAPGVKAYFAVLDEAMPQWYVEAYLRILKLRLMLSVNFRREVSSFLLVLR